MLLCSPDARADFYRWTDESGVTHYVSDPDRVPRRHRASVQRVVPLARPPALVETDPAPDDARAAPVGARPAAAPALPGAADPAGATGSGPAAAPRAARPAAAPEPGLPVRPPTASRSVEPAVAGPELAPEPAPPALPGPPPDPRAAELAELEREIAVRREEIKDLISRSDMDGGAFASHTRLRELSVELPRLQAELAALRSELGQ